MPFELRRSSPSDYDAIVELCCAAMDVTPAAPFLRRAHMAWKCWDEHPWWEGSRGYLLERDGRTAAHAVAWPVYLRRDGETLPALSLIDWAASEHFPGSGLILVKRLLKEVPRVFNVGGSDDTNVVLPRFGFEKTNEHHLLAKPLRPWRQMVTNPRRDWKLPLRFVRSSLWSRSGLSSPPAGWTAEPVADPAAAPAAWWAARAAPRTQMLRDAAWYRYVLASPAVPFELYDLRRGGETRGFFCLSRCPGQARLADYRLLGEETAEDWDALAALALEKARREPASAELTAWTSHDPLVAALERHGFRLLRSDAVRCSPAELEVAAGHPYLFTGLDSDFAFLHGEDIAYAT